MYETPLFTYSALADFPQGDIKSAKSSLEGGLGWVFYFSVVCVGELSLRLDELR